METYHLVESVRRIGINPEFNSISRESYNSLKRNVALTFRELNSVLSSFKESMIDQIPFAGSWTAGEVAEHIIKSLSGIDQLFTCKTVTNQRPYQENVYPVRKLFLDFSVRMKSPEFILPAEKIHSKKSLLSSLARRKTNMITAMKTLDLTETCIGFELPGFGTLTRYEWIQFFLVHTQRHTWQLKNILYKLNQAKDNDTR